MKNVFIAVLCIAFSLLGGFYLARAASLYERGGTKGISYMPKKEEGYLLKDYEGRVSVFEKGKSKPSIVFDVFLDNLPDIDKLKLKEGIYAENYDELLTLIEDYTN